MPSRVEADSQQYDAAAAHPAPPPPPPPEPAAQPGAPLSAALHRQLAELAASGSSWVDAHWLAVRWAALAAVAGSAAFLLACGHVPGWRQYTSLAELPPALLGARGARLPVVLHSAAQHGEALAVRAVHYPLLRRLLDSYRRLPPAVAAHRAADRGQLLTVHLAGPLALTPAGVLYVRRLELQGVHRLRLLSVKETAEQSWTAGAGPPAAARDATGGPRLLLAGDADGLGGGSSAVGPGRQRSALALPTDGLQPLPLVRPRQGPAGAMLWGELYAREPRRGLAALLPRRRLDVAERLVAAGDAAAMQQVDLEWLGASWHRADALHAAEQAAARAGLGMWAVRRPGMGEWSRRLARRVAAAAGGAVSNAAAAASSAVGNAAAAAGGAVSGAAAAAGGAVGSVAAAATSAVGSAAAAARSAAAGTLTPAPQGRSAISRAATRVASQAVAARDWLAAAVGRGRRGGETDAAARGRAGGAAGGRAPEAGSVVQPPEPPPSHAQEARPGS